MNWTGRMFLADLQCRFMKLSKREQMEIVQRNYRAIQFHTDPSPDLQMIAVRQSPDALEYIKQPCNKVKILLDLIS